MSITEVERFECEDDQGNIYTVVVSQKFIPDQEYTDKPTRGAPKGAAKSLTLDDGRHVNPVGKDMQTFKILDDGTVIRRSN